MSETQSDYEQLPPVMQQIISPLMAHTINAVAEQNIALSGQTNALREKAEWLIARSIGCHPRMGGC